MRNRRVLLASRPSGWVSEANFRIDEAPLPQPAQGEVLVKNLWLSLDPYMRGRMSDAKSYVKGVELGEVMVGQTVGEVISSRNEKFTEGDKVLTQLGWQLFGTTREATRVDEKRAPLSCYLGVMGMPITGEGEIEAENLTLACRNAVLNMMELLQERGFSREQAYVLSSVAVDLKISEIVDAPNWIVSAFLPESIFT